MPFRPRFATIFTLSALLTAGFLLRHAVHRHWHGGGTHHPHSGLRPPTSTDTARTAAAITPPSLSQQIGGLPKSRMLRRAAWDEIVAGSLENLQRAQDLFESVGDTIDRYPEDMQLFAQALTGYLDQHPQLLTTELLRRLPDKLKDAVYLSMTVNHFDKLSSLGVSAEEISRGQALALALGNSGDRTPSISELKPEARTTLLANIGILPDSTLRTLADRRSGGLAEEREALLTLGSEMLRRNMPLPATLLDGLAGPDKVRLLSTEMETAFKQFGTIDEARFSSEAFQTLTAEDRGALLNGAISLDADAARKCLDYVATASGARRSDLVMQNPLLLAQILKDQPLGHASDSIPKLSDFKTNEEGYAFLTAAIGGTQNFRESADLEVVEKVADHWGVEGSHFIRALMSLSESDPWAAIGQSSRELPDDLKRLLAGVLANRLEDEPSSARVMEAVSSFDTGLVESTVAALMRLDGRGSSREECLRAIFDSGMMDKSPKLLGSVAERLVLSGHDPESIASHLGTLAADGDTADIYSRFASAWAKSAPVDCSKWLVTLQKGGSRDAAIDSMCATLADDPSAALAWAAEIENSAVRSEVLHRIKADGRFNPALNALRTRDHDQ